MKVDTHSHLRWTPLERSDADPQSTLCRRLYSLSIALGSQVYDPQAETIPHLGVGPSFHDLGLISDSELGLATIRISGKIWHRYREPRQAAGAFKDFYYGPGRVMPYILN